MNPLSEIQPKLIAFRDCDKFEIYKDRQPAVANSTAADKQLVDEEMNACCNELLQYLATAAPDDKGLWTIVRASLERIEDEMLDTEDKEFCYELYFVLGEILGIDVEDHSISMEEKLMQQMRKLMERGGIRPEDLPPGFPKDFYPPGFGRNE